MFRYIIFIVLFVVIAKASYVPITSGQKNAFISSAKVSAAGVVSDELGDFINGSCAITDTSLFTCTFTTGYFASAPNCVVNVASTSTASDHLARQDAGSPSSTAIVIRTNASNDTTTFSKTALPFIIVCHGVSP